MCYQQGVTPSHMDSFTALDCSCYIQNVMFFSCSRLFVDFTELSFAFQQSDIFSPQDIVMIESQQKAIVTFGSKAHAVQFAKQWNRYSSLFPLLDRVGSSPHSASACLWFSPFCFHLLKASRGKHGSSHSKLGVILCRLA